VPALRELPRMGVLAFGAPPVVGLHKIHVCQKLVVEFVPLERVRKNCKTSLFVNLLDDLSGISRTDLFRKKNADNISLFALVFRRTEHQGRSAARQSADIQGALQRVVVGDDENVHTHFTRYRKNLPGRKNRIEGTARVHMKQASKGQGLPPYLAEELGRKTLQLQKSGRKVPGPHVGFHAWIQKIQGNLEKRLRAGPQVEKVAMPGERPLKAQVTRVGIGEWEGLPKRH